MARYVIGDVQGCCDSLEALVAQLPLRPSKDQLWFVGDLVNRGPKSLKTLRRIISAGPKAISILGNHDLHLLALAAGTRRPSATDTIASVLRAPDIADLLDWLRRRPLAHLDGDTLMVHAGVMPSWTATHTIRLAGQISERLRSRHWKDFMHEMTGATQRHPRDSAETHRRLRNGLAVLTRLRYLDVQGNPEFKCKLAPEQAGGLTPWFDVRGRRTSSVRIVFGHWSTLGLMVRPNVISLDTGCVWGRQLAAIRLEDHRIFLQASIETASDTD